jgi:rhodanese-related sulfurtransferase
MTANSISPSQLRADLAGGTPPIVIDVRRTPAFTAAREMLGGALRRDPEQVAAWAKALPAASSVVVYCVHGHEVSQKAAAALAAGGIAARYLDGGLEEGWKGIQGALDPKPANAATRWITRERPKIDRLADPALQALATIVRGADTGRLDLAPQAAGLHAISLGLSRNFENDHEMLAHGMVMYDALYAWCKAGA